MTEETQRLYQNQAARLGQLPPIEYEHHIEHQFDQLGNRQGSQLQNLGDIGYLLYGSGHVHGLMHGQQPLIDIERDALHGETGRYLHANDKARELHITRWHDSLGRLEDIRIENLPEQTLGRVPQPLIEQTSHRQYYYDALSQLTSIEMSERTLNFGYDGAGRLRAQEELIKGQETKRQRWEIDPAGNRLPVELTDEKQQQQDWAQMVYQNWKDPNFNLLRNGNSTLDSGQVQQWPDNRVGYLEELAWRYDEQGNRVEQLSLKQDSEGQYPRLRFGYDGANQLATVEIARVIGRGHVAAASKENYVYDALGRRLKKTHTDEQGKENVTYFGWDGDRLVHTETPREDGDRDIVHVVYEPGTFTPLVRLCTTAKGKQPVKPHLVIEAGLAGLPPDRRRDGAASAPKLQEMLTSMPGQVQKEMEESMRQVLKEGLTPLSRSILTGMGMDPEELLANTRQGLQEARQAEQTPVTVHYFHCDHLGAPLALTDQQANIVWAVKRDPWGNIEEEYNPQGIEQPIGLPGQHLDKETGLYYNRYRYYDPRVGAYINQDPIGLLGGVNTSTYTYGNPTNNIDPDGLFWQAIWGVARVVYGWYTSVIPAEVRAVGIGIDAYKATNAIVNYGSSPILGEGGNFNGGGATGSWDLLPSTTSTVSDDDEKFIRDQIQDEIKKELMKEQQINRKKKKVGC